MLPLGALAKVRGLLIWLSSDGHHITIIVFIFTISCKCKYIFVYYFTKVSSQILPLFF